MLSRESCGDILSMQFELFIAHRPPQQWRNRSSYLRNALEFKEGTCLLWMTFYRRWMASLDKGIK